LQRPFLKWLRWNNKYYFSTSHHLTRDRPTDLVMSIRIYYLLHTVKNVQNSDTAQITTHSDRRKTPDTYLGRGRLLGTECHDDNRLSVILLYIFLRVSFQQPVRVKNQQIIGCRPLQYIYFPRSKFKQKQLIL
jgi:hypothetical protein